MSNLETHLIQLEFSPTKIIATMRVMKSAEYQTALVIVAELPMENLPLDEIKNRTRQAAIETARDFLSSVEAQE